MELQNRVLLGVYLLTHVSLIVCIFALSTSHWLHGTVTYNISSESQININATVSNLSVAAKFQVSNSSNLTNATGWQLTVTRNCTKGLWKICCDNDYKNQSLISSSKRPNDKEYNQDHKTETHNHPQVLSNWTGCRSNGPLKNTNQTDRFRTAQFCFLIGVVMLGIGTIMNDVFPILLRLQGCKRVCIGIMVACFLLACAVLWVALVMILVDYKQGKDFDLTVQYEAKLAWSFTAGCVGAGYSVTAGILLLIMWSPVLFDRGEAKL